MTNFAKEFKKIESWLKDQGVENYTINADLTIDVAGHVRLDNRNLKSLPYQFGHIQGDFSCYQNHLTSLKNSPHTVDGSFDCFDNCLISLAHAPQSVGFNFICASNQLTSLVGAPSIVRSDFDCNNNFLTTLIGAPKHVGDSFQCKRNQLTSLRYGPEHVGQEYFCSDNNLENLHFFPKHIGGVFLGFRNPGLGEAQNITDFRTILELHLQHVRAAEEKELLLSSVSMVSDDVYGLLLPTKKHKI